jgi:F0F1-type ATP synthase assembly protein I
MDKLQKLARTTALAFSVVFELMAGPFLGYFIGTYLVKSFKVDGLAVSIGVLAGFLMGFYAAMLTIMKIGKINEKRSDQSSD